MERTGGGAALNAGAELGQWRRRVSPSIFSVVVPLMGGGADRVRALRAGLPFPVVPQW